MTNFPRPAVAGLLLACALISAHAQNGNGLDNLDWVEEKEPPPPAFSKDRALPLEMPNYVSVRVAIDPATVQVGNDGVVRYVVVMSNSTGSVNAMYEGIRCASDQVKTYARAGTSGEWNLVSNPAWRDLNDNQPSRHAFVFARMAACSVHVANSQDVVLKALKTQQKPRSAKFSNELGY